MGRNGSLHQWFHQQISPSGWKSQIMTLLQTAHYLRISYWCYAATWWIAENTNLEKCRTNSQVFTKIISADLFLEEVLLYCTWCHFYSWHQANRNKSCSVFLIIYVLGGFFGLSVYVTSVLNHFCILLQNLDQGLRMKTGLLAQSGAFTF